LPTSSVENGATIKENQARDAKSHRMLESIDMQEPLLVNAVGHSVGLLLFAGFLILVLRDRRRDRSAHAVLPAITATLALLWNAGSLFVLAASSGLIAGSDLVAALCFAVLSVLPAVLLQLSLEGRARGICLTGYALSAAAVGLHLAELITPDPRFHQAALWVIVFGFALLAVIAMLVARRASPLANRPTVPRILVSMCLFLFAISFVHFSPGHVRYAWSSEIALHHAGIPLALYVLLQDYRFLLLDAFVRFVANSVVASGFIVLGLGLNTKFDVLRHARENPFLQGILLVAACLVLVCLVFVRGKLQFLLTRVVFGRSDCESAISAIREAGGKTESEAAFLERAAPIVSSFVGVTRCEVQEIGLRQEHSHVLDPVLVAASGPESESLRLDQQWVEVRVPIRLMKGDGAFILLGRREGGRRYLSEDLQELARLGAVVAEQVEQFRNAEIQRLVSQAELRALQSQINPHFLFNALNTLYGTIPREVSEARRMVLNLAEIFRYSLRSDRTFIALSEEIQIIRAYLQIESLRLGDRLKTEIVVDESAEQALIPILSIQPLVENAVKHGVAARTGPGIVRLRARAVPGGVQIEVSDDGRGFQSSDRRTTPAGEGVGLDNVRQRLKLCFGESAQFNIDSSNQGSTVGFFVPANRIFQVAREEVSA
jgi:two-component system LytT family sensor kinase